MRVLRFLPALGAAISMMAICAPARADDPHERMTPEQLEQDRATIRRLNREQLEYVQRRDAGYAQGWRQASGDEPAPASHARSAETHRAATENDYADQRREYEQAMADWREDVAACRAGYYEYCAR